MVRRLARFVLGRLALSSTRTNLLHYEAQFATQLTCVYAPSLATFWPKYQPPCYYIYSIHWTLPPVTSFCLVMKGAHFVNDTFVKKARMNVLSELF